jgi:WD40 repeat protein
MPETDRVLIDPTPEALTEALATAAAQANADGRVRRLDWPPPGLADFLGRWRAEREGRQQWNGGLPRAKGGDTRTAVAVVWWTDHGGRKHVRVAGRRGPFSTNQLADVLCPANDRPAAWVVYPEQFYFRAEGGRRSLWCACPCGAAGSPESLGWMGDRCGPCHDLRESGLTPPDAGPPRRTLLKTGERDVESLAFAGPDRLVTLSRFGREARVWDLADGTAHVLPRADWRDYAAGLAVAPDGRAVAVNLRSESVAVYDTAGLQVVARLPARQTTAMAFRPDGAVLATLTRDAVALYDPGTGAERARFAVPSRSAWTPGCLAWSPDGRRLAAGVGPLAVRVLDAETGAAAADLAGPEGGTETLAFSPDGTALAARGGVGLRLWDWPAGRERATVRTPGTGLAFTPHGRFLLTGGLEGEVRPFRVADVQPLPAIAWHAGRVRGLALPRIGRWLATSGDDAFIKLWPVAALLGG